jgi:hypothetical protein
MSLPPFNDGFPTDPSQAINYSYFLTEEEANDWRVWLQKVGQNEQDELVNVLHQMWLESQAEALQSGMAPSPQPSNNSNQGQNNMQQGQPQNQQSQFPQQQPQNQQQPPMQGQPQNQSQFLGNSFAQPQPTPNYQTIPQFDSNLNQSGNQQQTQPTQQFQPQNNFEPVSFVSQPPQPPIPSPSTQNPQNSSQPSLEYPQPPASNNSNLPKQENTDSVTIIAEEVLPMIPDSTTTSELPPQLEKIETKVEVIKQEQKVEKATFSKPISYSPSPIISKSLPEIDFKPKQSQPPQPPAPTNESSNDTFSFESADEIEQEVPQMEDDEMEKIISKPTKPYSDKPEEIETPKLQKRVNGMDFSAIRESSNKTALYNLKSDYIKIKQEQEETYLDFIDKTTDILANVEDINYYIEAMTDKVLNINDEVVKQSRDIQSLQNSTQNRGPALQDQIDEIRYDIEKIAKELRNARIEMKRSNDEIRQRLSILEADSFRQSNDGIEARLALIKSDMSKMQDMINTLNITNQSNKSGNAFTLPSQSPRVSRLDAVSFRK